MEKTNKVPLLSKQGSTRTLSTVVVPPTQQTKPAPPADDNVLLKGGLFIAFVLAFVFERVLFKAMVSRVESYRYVTMQLVALCYIPVALGLHYYHKHGAAEFRALGKKHRSAIKYIFMGLLDSLHSLFLFIPGGMVTATMSILLLQANVPFTVLASVVFLRKKFSARHYVGVFITVLGLFLVLFPLLVTTSQTPLNSDTILWNALMFMASCAFAALSAVFKEHTLKQHPINMYLMSLWTSIIQFIFGCIFYAVALHVQNVSIFTNPYPHIADNIQHGLACLFLGEQQSSLSTGDQCEFSILLVVGYVLAALAFNLLLSRIIPLLGPQTMYRAVILAVPLVFLACIFSSLDSFKVSFSYFDWLSLCVVVIGLSVYHTPYEPGHEHHDPNRSTTKAARSASVVASDVSKPVPAPMQAHDVV
eukprot:GILK01005171.1.p1 GENE.GILK01005171.1~~GILK01005171.1.p1  ORF type:complete len:434 (-),score=66.26 GILK01005171.1:300-1556(-)